MSGWTLLTLLGIGLPFAAARAFIFIRSDRGDERRDPAAEARWEDEMRRGHSQDAELGG